MKRLASGPTFVTDFDPMCKCGNHATHILTVHAVDYCTEDRPEWVKFICKPCIGNEVVRAATIVADGEEWCSSCGLILVTLSDIIVRLSPIPEGGRCA